MASPFAVLRRNQKILLAVFGVIIMFVFVIGGGIDDYLSGRGQSNRASQAVVTWKYGSLTDQEIAYMRHKHQVTMRFLEEVVKLSRERKGTPKVPNVAMNELGQLVPGLRRCNATADFVQTVVLAKKAEQLGLVLDDAAVKEFLVKLGGEKLSDGDFASIIDAIPNRHMTPQQVFDELRLELTAQDLLGMVRHGLFTTSPAAAWKNFNRLHHRVQAEVLPIPVAEFIDKVKDPTDKEAREFFEQHKSRYSHPDFPDPGFRQRMKAAFEYLKFDFNQFLTEEKKKISDAEIQKEYDLRISRGDFKVPELPEAPSEKPADAKPEDAKPEDAKPDEAKPAAPTDKPAAEAPKPSEKPEPKPADEPAKKPAEQSPEKPSDDAPKKPSSEPSDGSADPLNAKASPCDDADEKPADEKPTDEKPTDAKPTDEKPATEKPATEKPADEKPAAKADEKKPEEKSGDDKPAEAKEGEAKEGEAKEGEAKEGEAKEGEAKPTEKKTRYRTLEEVRDEIATSLARPKAQEAKKKLMDEAKRELDVYSRWYRTYEMFKGTPEESKIELRTLDPKELATRLNVVYGKTPLADPLEIYDHELGKGANFSFASGNFSQLTFGEIAYRQGLAKYQPEQIMGQDPDIEFLFWKTDERPAREPPYDEAKDLVIRTWKLQKAIDLAMKDAEEKAKEARDKESLAAAFGEKVKETNEFAWMSAGAVPFSSGVPSISRVEQVDAAGADFMEAVFKLKVGEVGTAVNQPKTVVYVVRIVKESPTEEMLRDRFIASGIMNMEVMHLSLLDHQRNFAAWYQDLEREMNVKWAGNANPYGLNTEEDE